MSVLSAKILAVLMIGSTHYVDVGKEQAPVAIEPFINGGIHGALPILGISESLFGSAAFLKSTCLTFVTVKDIPVQTVIYPKPN